MTKELSAKDIKKISVDDLYAPADEAAGILVACRRGDYSASRIARAVEDADTHLLNLNVTALRHEATDSEYIVVALRVARRDAMPVARSIERYGYEVLDFEGPAVPDDDTVRTRAEALLRYLEM